jgi:hypothetical protein
VDPDRLLLNFRFAVFRYVGRLITSGTAPKGAQQRLWNRESNSGRRQVQVFFGHWLMPTP